MQKIKKKSQKTIIKEKPDKHKKMTKKANFIILPI